MAYAWISIKQTRLVKGELIGNDNVVVCKKWGKEGIESSSPKVNSMTITDNSTTTTEEKVCVASVNSVLPPLSVFDFLRYFSSLLWMFDGKSLLRRKYICLLSAENLSRTSLLCSTSTNTTNFYSDFMPQNRWKKEKIKEKSSICWSNVHKISIRFLFSFPRRAALQPF